MIAVPALRTEYPLAIRDKIERLWRMCAFGAPFGSVFQPVFGGGEVAEVPWYLLGDIAAANCLAAHQPLGAASLAASYDDIAHEATTWDCAPGVAPTFNAATGWYLNNTKYLIVGSGAIVSAVPLTLVCLFNSDVNNADDYLLGICDSEAANIFSLLTAGTIAGDPVAAITRVGGIQIVTTSTTGFTTDNWFVGAAVFSAINSRSIYINGGSKATDTTSNAPSGLDQNLIGARSLAGILSSYYTGYIAADAWYNIALSDAQVLAVSNALLAKVA